MIDFTELRVKNGYLIISADVREIEDYYDNVTIKSITVDSQNTFSSSGPSSLPLYRQEYTNNPKKVSLVLDSLDLKNADMERTMFFVYVEAQGYPSSLVPCGLDNSNVLGVTFSLCPVYNETLKYAKEVEEKCDVPKGFIEEVTRFLAISYSISSGHYLQAIKYYEKFYKGIGDKAEKGCLCHGR